MSSDFRKFVADSDRATFFCGIAVFLFLALETVVEVYFKKDSSCAEISLRLIANLGVALGVLGEVIFAHRVSKEAKEQQKESDEKIAGLNELAAEANKQAKQAEERTEELRKSMGPRLLTPEQKTLISTLRGVTDPIIVTSTPAWECRNFSKELSVELEKAGLDIAIGDAVNRIPAFGIVIAFPLSIKDADFHPLKILFEKAGLRPHCVLRSQWPLPEFDHEKIILIVFEKEFPADV